MRQYAIETHEPEFKGSSEYDLSNPSIDLGKLELETHRTHALLAVTVAMIGMPSKKSSWERIAAMVREPKIELKTLKEISTQLKVLTISKGTSAMTRSVEFSAQVRAGRTDRSITFLCSTEQVDRHGTRVSIDGLDTTNYMKNPVFCLMHDAYGSFVGVPDISNTVGKTTALRKTAKGLEIDVEFLDAAINPRAEQALAMVRAGALSATSIGFIPREVVVNLENDREIPTITKSELLEVSLVVVPSNTGVGVLAGRSKQAARPSYSY